MAFGIDDAVALGLKLIDKWFPTPEERARAEADLLKMKQDGEFKMYDILGASDAAQSQVNLAEAQSESLFKSGWRPSIGWVCAAAFAGNFVVGPSLTWLCDLFNIHAMWPEMDMSQLMPVLFGMLGLGAYRTFEKVKGVN